MLLLNYQPSWLIYAARLTGSRRAISGQYIAGLIPRFFEQQQGLLGIPKYVLLFVSDTVVHRPVLGSGFLAPRLCWPAGLIVWRR